MPARGSIEPSPPARTRRTGWYTLSINEWTFLAPVGLIQSTSLLGRGCTGFSLMELIHLPALTPLVSSLFPTAFAGCLPRPTSAAGCPVTQLSPRLRYLHSRPSTDRASLAISLSLIGLLTPVPPGDPASPPEVTHRSSVTVPSANTLVRWVNENAFIVQARPCPTFGRPVHLRGGPHRFTTLSFATPCRFIPALSRQECPPHWVQESRSSRSSRLRSRMRLLSSLMMAAASSRFVLCSSRTFSSTVPRVIRR